ncbi:hypothetical protein [Pseudoalteromonas sp. MMG022]|uniref:hypothetical protein n=1 Tax=Pseudoalteromonas sp. MMG022 TaxID=2909978 RepID=UPI001F23E8FC|nr:hypothetical protein [Pseudoalteromonas sp. MMG022]MCF6436709.1 hypothetical protein [Pseudoalteromonas sp. MMG022]
MTLKDIDSLERELANLRLQVDLLLAPKCTSLSNKPYPLGRCLEIRDAMFKLIEQHLHNDPSALSPMRQYMQKTNMPLTKVWGSLRDEYFQNAMVVGKWYIDCANDTVNANKPRIEIKPLAESGFSAIQSFEQFVKIAQSYWQVSVYKNSVFPALAPYLPLICKNKHGTVWLAAANDDTIKMAMDSNFSLSERILKQLPEPPDSLLSSWQLSTKSHSKARDELLSHSGDPIDYCREYQHANLATNIEFRNRVVRAFISIPKMP